MAPSTQVELGVLGHVALDEQRATRRVDPDREQPGGKVERPVCKGRRIVLDRKCVKVDDAVEGVVDVLVRDPVAQSAQIIAQMDVPRGLHARKNPAHTVHRHGGTW